MKIAKTVIAFIAAVAVAYSLASVFYTMRTLAAHSAVGIQYTQAQQIETYLANFTGLWIYGALIAIALLAGFVVAFAVKKLLPALAPVAYPVAGGAAIYVLLTLVETQLGGGAGIIGGARTGLGVALQCLAGLAGGLVFAVLRPRGR